MNKTFRAFLVIDKGTPPERGEDMRLYSTYRGGPYQEDSLRQWAHETFGTPLNATLNVVARDIYKGGWLLYKGIWQADP